MTDVSLRVLCDSILRDELMPDLATAMRGCTYRFNTRRTPPPTTRLQRLTYAFRSRNDIDVIPSDAQLLRFYSMASYFEQMMVLMNRHHDFLSALYITETVQCYDCLSAMQTVRKLQKMEELFARFREELRTIAFRVRQAEAERVQRTRS